MDELSEILARATASIEPGYFRLSIHGGDPIYRERVYCYELYHQMRKLWPMNCAFTLNGEVDKAAHPILTRLGADGFKPDLLIHQPGEMGGNHAVMEVKSARASRNGLAKDINTLATFLGAVGYKRGIYLIYGEEISERFVEHIKDAGAAVKLPAPIEVWLHRAPGEPAKHSLSLETQNPSGPLAKAETTHTKPSSH